MARAKRLSRNDFKQIAAARFKREHGKYFTLSYGSMAGAVGGLKFACVVSKKISNKATKRNLIKRRCREAARAALEKKRLSGAAVFYAKKDADGATFQGVKADIESLIARIS